MAVYWRQNLSGLGQAAKPPIATLNGLQLMRRPPVEAVIRGQDYVVGTGRRIVASGGLRGSETFDTPNTDPTSMAGTHPTPTTRRRISAGAIDVTPGCVLRCWVVCVPSGETQVTGTTAGGAQGRIEVDTVWTDADATTVSTTHGVDLPASTETNGAEPTSMWDDLHRLTFAIRPPGLVPTDEMRRWCQHVHAQVQIYAVAGARPVDVVVWEEPFSVAMEADDAGDLWCSHLYGAPGPDGPGLGLAYPWQRLSETSPDGDPRGGTWHMQDVQNAQRVRLGPVLFSWSGALESSGATSVDVTSSTFVPIEGGGSTSFDGTEPGVCCGTGGYARRQIDNSSYVLRDRIAEVPVLIRVLAANDTEEAAYVRIQTNVHSYVDVSLALGAEQWHVAYGHLECGITPDQFRVVQLFARHVSGETISIAAIDVYRCGGYQPRA